MNPKFGIDSKDILRDEVKTKVYIDDLEKRLETNIKDLNEIKLFIKSYKPNQI